MDNNSELRLYGRSVSRGIASGKAVCLYGKRRQFFRVSLGKEELDRETRRFRAAIRLSNRQLEKLAAGQNGSVPASMASVLDFHRSVLHDPALIEAIEQQINDEGVNAEWAVKQVTDSYLLRYKNISDQRMRERYRDLEDVTDRILGALSGSTERFELEPATVIVAHELNPSTLIELSSRQPVAIVTEQGGWTSHTYILARELAIPAVTGIKGLYQLIRSGDRVVVDGFTGEVVARPTDRTTVDHAPNERFVERLRNTGTGSFRTLDGREIKIFANADLPGRYESAKRGGARGIGLFRSEFCFRRSHDLPGEEEQYRAYRRMAELTGAYGIRIRTFDISADELVDHQFTHGKNPALGLRGVRLSLETPVVFRTQLRAVLRASSGTSIDVILPMVSDVEEIRATRAIMIEERERLEVAGVATGYPRLGAMIEVPSAVLTIDDILTEADILCLGTNDLVQYILAVDRDNESVSQYFNSLHPAVIKAIGTVLRAAEKHRKPCIVCGEMAGSPFYVPLLIGLGAKALSMNPATIPHVLEVVQGIAYEETLSLVREVESSDTAAKNDATVKRFADETWQHLTAPTPTP